MSLPLLSHFHVSNIKQVQSLSENRNIEIGGDSGSDDLCNKQMKDSNQLCSIPTQNYW